MNWSFFFFFFFFGSGLLLLWKHRPVQPDYSYSEPGCTENPAVLI